MSMRKGESEGEKETARSKKWDGKGTGEKTRRDGPCSDYIRQPPRKTSRHLVLSPSPNRVVGLPSGYE